MNFDRYIEELSGDIIKTTQELVKIKSVESAPVEGGPFGQGVKDCLTKALEICQSMGFKTKNVDGYAGYAEYGNGKDLIGILVHLDVVPEGTGWEHNPYGADIIDGKMYGRGTSDNKGPAVSVLYALKLSKNLKVDFNKRIRIIFGCNEETGSKGIEYYAKHEEIPSCGFTPDGLFPIINSEKGILRIDLIKDFKNEKIVPGFIRLISLNGGTAPNIVPDFCECKIELTNNSIKSIKDAFGKYEYKDDLEIEFSNGICIIKSKGFSVASSIPEKGKNAITRLLEFLSKFTFSKKSLNEYFQFLSKNIGQEYNGKTFGIQMKDDISGVLTVNIGLADINEEKGTVTLDIRYPVKRTGDEIIGTLKKKTDNSKIILKKRDEKKPLYVPENHFMIKILSKVYEEVTGTKAELLSIGGGTYARALDNMVAFGPLFPGRQILAHQKNEFLYLEDLVKMTKVYVKAIEALVE